MMNVDQVCNWCNRVLHHPTCPRYPEFGYDENGVPHKQSQLFKAMEKVGDEMARKVNEAVLRRLENPDK